MSLSLDGEESTLELEEVANDKVRRKSGMTIMVSVMKLNNSLILLSVGKTILTSSCFILQIHRHSVFDDAFIMIYSISDAASFIYIKREVCRLREKIDVDRPIIIVANKTDLNRTRAVTSSGSYTILFMDSTYALSLNLKKCFVKKKNLKIPKNMNAMGFFFAEGKAVAHHYNCKYVETSVAFQVRVDELLVALVRQIRLTLDPKTMIGRSSADWNRGPKHLPRRFIKARTLLQRLFGRKPRSKRNGETCEEIFRL